MKKRVLTAMLAGALSASMVVPALATSNVTEGGATPSSNGTKVMAGIMLKDPDAKIKVEVPTLFAFVVNGSITKDDIGVVTSTNDGIMLPNVKVNVKDVSGEVGSDAGDTSFSIETVGEGDMIFTNYSTKKNEEYKDGDDKAPRVGLDVKISGFIENKGDAKSRNYWEHIANAGEGVTDPAVGNKDTFKKYTISIGGEKFNKAEDGGFSMANPIELDAPNLEWVTADEYRNMNSESKLAEAGNAKIIDFDVEVGGQKNQYRQVEQSAKVGTIVWTVSAEVTVKKADNEGIYTAPNNEYLDGVDGGATDPDNGIGLIPAS